MAVTNSLRLSLLEQDVLKKYSGRFEKEIPKAVRIIVFGSRARGDSDEDSDMDVAVVFDMPLLNKEVWGRIWDIKWRVLESLDAEEFPLSLTLIAMNDLESRDYGLEDVIKREGRVIWEREN
jgi:uncharacterized protein